LPAGLAVEADDLGQLALQAAVEAGRRLRVLGLAQEQRQPGGGGPPLGRAAFAEHTPQELFGLQRLLLLGQLVGQRLLRCCR